MRKEGKKERRGKKKETHASYLPLFHSLYTLNLPSGGGGSVQAGRKIREKKEKEKGKKGISLFSIVFES